MLDYAYQNDVILKNPCNKMVKSDIGKESSKKEALTIGQQKAFCNIIIGSAYEYQYRFLLQTGLRTGEMVGLKWSDVDLENRTLTVNRTMEYRHSTKEWRTGEPKSKAGYRTIPLTDEAVEILKLQKKKNHSFSLIPIEWAEFIFLCKKGTPVKNSTYDTMLFKLCDKAGIPRFSMHVLRHTFATRCIEAGMKPKTLQAILGHSNIGITMNLYVHTTEDQKHKEIDQIAEALKVI
jgi:integrase